MTAIDEPLAESPAQTAGPYVHIGCLPNFSGITGVYAEDPGSRMVDTSTPGESIQIRGQVFDGDGVPLTDAVIEIWQADAAGRYPSRGDAAFSGWGRQPCDPQTGEFHFTTIRPGQLPYVDGRPQAPHITFWIVARGINIALHTRLYFADESAANALDPVLAQVEPAERIETLLASSGGDGCFRFDIHLQGAHETVFFDM